MLRRSNLVCRKVHKYLHSGFSEVLLQTGSGIVPFSVMPPFPGPICMILTRVARSARKVKLSHTPGVWPHHALLTLSGLGLSAVKLNVVIKLIKKKKKKKKKKNTFTKTSWFPSQCEESQVQSQIQYVCVHLTSSTHAFNYTGFPCISSIFRYFYPQTGCLCISIL